MCRSFQQTSQKNAFVGGYHPRTSSTFCNLLFFINKDLYETQINPLQKFESIVGRRAQKSGHRLAASPYWITSSGLAKVTFRAKKPSF